MRSTMGRQAYSCDLTDKQWDVLRPLIPLASLEGRPATVERREIVNAILYVLRSGCPWRLLPHEFPAWGTVYYYFLEGLAKGSGSRSCRPCACRCARKKAEMLSQAQRSLTANRSKPVRCAVYELLTS